jgi:hypothetical protein
VVAKFATDKSLGRMEVHHRVGLEYAHMFPERDPNAIDNLIGLDKFVHRQISHVWTAFRAASKDKKVTRATVDKVAKSIDDEFAAYYDTPFDEDAMVDGVMAAFHRAESEVKNIAGGL